MSILVKGFAPFGGSSRNASWEAVSLLPETIAGHAVYRMRLPVCYGQAGDLLVEMLRRIRPTVTLCCGVAGGRKVITFANVLQHDVFPLADILRLAQQYGQGEMRRPVEIEFAANLNDDRTGTFYLLQIRPIVDCKKMLEEDLSTIPDEDVIIRSNNSLGHGIMDEMQDLVYVKTDGYSASNNQLIAYDIEKLNAEFLREGKNYILVGPGRWGSSDTWLGIPVKWPHISAARVIVEAGLTNYRVDPSQGTHFFQNLTSFGVGYFTVNAYRNDGIYDQAYLNSLPAVHETKFLRHIHFDRPLVVKMDGKKNIGVVMK